MTIPEDLRAIRELMEKATPGPWAHDEDAIVTTNPDEVNMERVLIADLGYFTIPHYHDNAALIVAAINALPALLSAAEQGARAEKALRRIAAPSDCGCRPCTGQCRSAEVLMIELEERQEIARAALPQSPSKVEEG